MKEKEHIDKSDVGRLEDELGPGDTVFKEEKPMPGDRVKLTGGHRFAGYTGKYVGDHVYPFGGKRPAVRIDTTGELTYVNYPETEMKKI